MFQSLRKIGSPFNPASCFLLHVSIIPLLILSYLLLTSVNAEAYQPAVVSAHPEASKVGIEILKKGGSAADAAVATALALSVVEPFNSGLGGGGFMLYYEAKTKRFTFVDYREVAPMRATSGVYGKDRSKLEGGVLSVAVPGFLLGMETIHKRWRRVSWPAVIEPSIELARNGIPLLGRLKEKIEENRAVLEKDPEMARVFVEPLGGIHFKVKMDDLAKTLEDIRTGGSAVFYSGGIAKKIAGFMRLGKGLISEHDLNIYQVHLRRPFRFSHGDYTVVTAPRPSSGGVGLNILFRRAIVNDLADQVPYSPRAYEFILSGMKDYFDYRQFALGDTTWNIMSQTTHLSVIDGEGNMAAMTNTLNYPFGSGLMVPGTGIILNNEMDDFALAPNTANAIKPGHRPLSSMAPTIIFMKKKPYLVIGTPGGRTIPLNLFQVLFFSWEWGAPISKSIKQSKVYYAPRSRTVLVEEKVPKRVIEFLSEGNEVHRSPPMGNIQALMIRSEKKTIPLSDPRGEGKGYTLPPPPRSDTESKLLLSSPQKNR